MKTEHQRGGHRPNAGRKPRPAAERRVTVTLRLPPELARHVDAAAERCGMTRTAVIVAWLEQGQRGASFP
jgi:hypothetical protein